MTKAPFEKPVVFMLRPNLLQRVSNIAEASYFLLHRWPQERGPTYLAARDACYLAALGRMTADDCRRDFGRALAEAGMPNLDIFGETDGGTRTEKRTSTHVASAQARLLAHKNPHLPDQGIKQTRRAGTSAFRRTQRPAPAWHVK